MTNPPNQAVRHFHGTEGYNCAQAILKTFGERFAIEPDTADSQQCRFDCPAYEYGKP